MGIYTSEDYPGTNGKATIRWETNEKADTVQGSEYM